ncbi:MULTISPECIES: TetR/AcrR family transcriptional regulator [Rhodopseudomonas]|uniref:TetR family transcriptional regulator n=1 Tax=Rhodopseudomonas palustris TaxID=1076 RepID=A0A0D7EHC0_RHOPL|nr:MULTISPECIES: TetR/AcrR family transcriptional regulator [Rhodopseudomonas]KIZ38922.1 TetR family transcriptional regulator [Rhodopseudomonas palustris]MDF3809083.1 TetR/AcrR family transcriptional regulator [Rhodopseudomonas sp. BAL398]WOK16403.1 TetR/AcrR family transcriptional regulator [Rhodopseudomonas sp. BAL398]
MRKTRQQQRLETRERLIASAHASIVRGGIGGLSLRGLCDEAGYSQGAFYSNFASRDELLLALMERHLHDEVEALRRLVETTQDKALDDVLAALALHLGGLAKQPHWSLLAIELQLYAQRDPGFAESYNAAKVRSHAAFAGLVEDLLRRHSLAPALPPLQIAIGLYALWSGLVVQGTVPGARPRDQLFLAFLRAVIGAPLSR